MRSDFSTSLSYPDPAQALIAPVARNVLSEIRSIEEVLVGFEGGCILLGGLIAPEQLGSIWDNSLHRGTQGSSGCAKGGDHDAQQDWRDGWEDLVGLG